MKQWARWAASPTSEFQPTGTLGLPMAKEPSLMNDSNLRALVDASGFAFQLAVEDVVRAAGGNFEVKSTEHGWVHPRTLETGFADIVLDERNTTPRVRLIVECKRSRDANWVFLRPDESARRQATRFPISEEAAHQNAVVSWMAVADGQKSAGTDTIGFMPLSRYSSFCVVRGSGENDKPLLERLAGQVLKASEAIAHEQMLMDLAHQSNAQSPMAWVYLPVIVTNAQLSICDFNPSDINVTDGVLPESARFKDESIVRFTKNLAFGTDPRDYKTLEAANAAKDRTVFVVNAAAFSDFLQQFRWSGAAPPALRPFTR